MSSFKNPVISTSGVDHEKECALRDAQAIIWERGKQIIIKPLGEDDISRDNYNSIKKRSSSSSNKFTIYAYPIDFNPSKKSIDNVGLNEDTEVMVYTAMQDWIESSSSYDFNSIDLMRSVAIINGITYKISDKKKHSMFYDDYLYIVLGLKSL